MIQEASTIGYRDGVLCIDGLEASALAEAVGTPTYVYSAREIRTSYKRLERAFAPLGAHIHYAVKACSNLHILRLLRSLGASMDVVSGGELERAWLSGTPMGEIAFAGVGKTDAEIRAALDGRCSPMLEESRNFTDRAATRRGTVGMFNVESESELQRIAELAAEFGVVGRVCIRVNPNVDPRTHEYTTTGKDMNKFGIDVQRVTEIFDAYAGNASIDLLGLHVHIGSPVRETEPYVAAVEVLLSLLDELERSGHSVSMLDLGGGWAVDYQEGEAPEIEAYPEALQPLLAERIAAGLEIVIEPGRSIVANAGVLLTRVQHIKEGRTRRFVICDAGMHTMIRPALYQAFHFVWPAHVTPEHQPPKMAEELDLPDLRLSEVVGPICESADFLARSRQLPEVVAGDLLAVFSAGAYGMSMASNYNAHGRPAEILVDGDQAIVVSERQTLASLLDTETTPRKLLL